MIYFRRLLLLSLFVLLSLTMMVSCGGGGSNTQSETEATAEPNNDKAQPTAAESQIIPIVDTIQIATPEVDNIFTYEFGEKLFRKLKSSNIPHTTQKMVNIHNNELTDLIYSFETEGAKFDFLELHNKDRLFLISAESSWEEANLNNITEMKQRVEELVTTVQQYTPGDEKLINAQQHVVCYSNPDGYTEVYVSFSDKGISKYLFVNWVD